MIANIKAIIFGLLAGLSIPDSWSEGDDLEE